MKKENKPEKIADRYEVLETIGTGGMGTVYKVLDPLLNKEFAIKVLLKDADGTTAARLQREAIAAGKLNHPHICRIDNFGQTAEGTPYMVMEYLQGQDLAEFLRTNGALSIESALEVAIQVCGALAYAHQHGIVHRDLKPANVLLLKSRSDAIFTKLLDFGVARYDMESRKGDLTEAGSILGSPLYMSPEQIQGENVGPAADIYSFGCMLFEMLTGEPPLRGASVVETFAMHRSTPAPLLSAYGKFPPALETLISHCLQKEPEKRTASAKDVLKKLEEIQQELLYSKEQTVTVQDDSEKEERERKKKLIVKLSLSTLGLLLIGGLVFIVRDIIYRKQIPETKVNSKIEIMYAAGQFMGDEASKDSQFIFSKRKDSAMVDVRAMPNVTDADLKILSGKKMCKLNLDETNIDGSGLKYLTDSEVIELSLNHTNLKDENLKYVKQIPKLRSLHIFSDFISGKGLSHISDMRFYTLELGSRKMNMEDLSVMKNLNVPHFLEFKSKFLTTDCLKHVGASKNLEGVTLHLMPITGDLGVMLKQYPNLKELELKDNASIDPQSLRSLIRSNLYSLRIKSPVLSKEQMKAITSMDKLELFVFLEGEIDPDSFQDLENMKKLTSLSLCGVHNLSGKVMTCIARKKTLSVLTLRDTDINEEDLKGLLSLPVLCIIDVSHCEYLDQASIERFKDQYQRRWGRKIEVNY